MPRDARFGLALALAGALILTPDALFMRISGMDGAQMLAWRGLCMGAIFLIAWALTSRDRRGDVARIGSAAAALLITCQVLNNALFPLGIAIAPVAPVLLGVATIPVWAALLARLVHGEPTAPATWRAILFVLAGITLAVTESGAGALDGAALAGAACGLGVAMALALNFVTLRHNPELPLLLAIGLGALIAGGAGLAVTTPARMTDGVLWAILITALFIIPVSFFSLSQASRHTSAANVSLLLLLETALAPIWVWLGIGEAPTPRMIAGGAIVIVTLALYLAPRRRFPLARRAALPKEGREQVKPGR